MRTLLAILFLAASLPNWAAASITVAVAASAKPEWYWSFWQGETASGYREKILNAVRPIIMGDSNDTAMVVLPDPALTDQLYRDKAPWPRHQSACNDTSTTTLLVIRVQDVFPVLTPFQTDVFGNSRETPSAHWPALYLTAFDCRNGKRVAEHPILSPHNSDHFVFETDLITYTRTFWKKTIAPPPNND